MEENFVLALQNHRKNNFQDAESLYNEILKKNPNHFDTIYNLSKLLAQTKRFSLAKPLLYKATKLKPDYAKAHNLNVKVGNFPLSASLSIASLIIVLF